MIDKRVDYDGILRSCGCDNCEHMVDGRADLCTYCESGVTPSRYKPRRGTIQEKVFYDDHGEPTYEEYLRFLKTGE